MADFDPYPLTELNYLPMPLYVHIFLTFQTSNTEDCVTNLHHGVSRFVLEWPFLAGNIAKSGLNQKAYQVQPPSESDLEENPMLRVRTHKSSTHILKASEQILNEYIPINPQSRTPFPALALRFQANIMTDGIVLTLCWHHRLMDASGCQTVLDGLSRFCRLGEGASGIPKNLSGIQDIRQQIRNLNGTQKKTAVVENTYGHVESHFEVDQLVRGYKLCSEKIEMLREACTSRLSRSGQSPQLRLSRDDIVTAIIWLSAAHARNRAFATPRSSFVRFVNLRDILKPSIPTSFVGNIAAVSKSYCDVHDIPELQDEDNSTAGIPPGITYRTITHLTYLAWSSRLTEANESIDESHVGDILSTLRESSDWNSFNFLPVDVSVSSLRKLTLYKLDFGKSFRPVRDVDMLSSHLHGQSAIFPARNSSSDAHWEIRVALPKKALDFLEEDRLWTWAGIKERPRL